MFQKSRRKYLHYPFLDKQFQFLTAFLFSLIALINAFLFSLAFIIFSRESFFVSSPILTESMTSQSIFNDQIVLWLKVLILIAIPEAILVLIFGLFFTHRVMGPVYGLYLRLQSIAKGKIPEKMYVRKHYFLSWMADQMNTTIEALEKREKALDEIREEARSGNLEGIRAKLAALPSDSVQ